VKRANTEHPALVNAPHRTVGHSVRWAVALTCAVAVLGGCGSSDNETEGSSTQPLASPDLQCDGSPSGSFNPDVDAPTFPDADQAAIEMLRPSQRIYGGDIVQLRSGSHALVVDGRQVLVAHGAEGPEGGYVFSALDWCDEYFDQDGDSFAPPRTEPFVTESAG
jgi:hypothetical protein